MGGPQSKTPRRLLASGGCWNNSLTMTYFHTGCSTIIGAKSFHGPVRDGKGWDQLAMVIRHDGAVAGAGAAATQTGTSVKSTAANPVLQVVQIVLHAPTRRLLTGQGYRDKPHGQLVLVSLTHYCASTPSLSTSWSRTTLQGDRSLREVSSQGEFPA
jgi:hypothetical protein